MTLDNNQPSEQPTLYCANHPHVATALRCNRCEKPICSKCAIRTPIGYRCRECVRGQQKSFDTAKGIDYPLAFVLAGVLSLVGSFIVPRLGFFTLFAGPIMGMVISEVVRFAVRRRRSRYLYWVATISAGLGSLPLIIIYLLSALLQSSQGGFGIGYLLPLLWMGLYTFSVTSTVYYRLKGIQI
jgi:hypothetical protein